MALSTIAVTRTVQASAAEETANAISATPANSVPRPPIMIELEALKETARRQGELRDSLLKLSNEQTGHYSEYLAALAHQTTESMWIVGLQVSPNGRDMELRGRLTDNRVLPVYLGKLASEPQFRGRRFAQIQLKALDAAPGAEGQGANVGVTEFSIKAVARPDQAASQAGQP